MQVYNNAGQIKQFQSSCDYVRYNRIKKQLNLNGVGKVELL